jgi:hypothetical protein
VAAYRLVDTTGLSGRNYTTSRDVTRLEHVSYIFMITGETSTQRVFASGEATAVSGVTVGVYLFRNTDAPSHLAATI